MAMLDLERQAPAAQRALAYHDHMVDQMMDGRNLERSPIDARATMMADMRAGRAA